MSLSSVSESHVGSRGMTDCVTEQLEQGIDRVKPNNFLTTAVPAKPEN